MCTKLCKGETNVAHDDSCLELWHMRLGYMSKKGLQVLARKALLPNVKRKTLERCTYCLADEQHRVSFSKRNPPRRRKRVLDLVHIDVCSMAERSLGGALYFVTYNDDHSRKVFMSLLKIKDQVLEAFKEFHARVECEIGRKLKCA
ncbi:UNVERIFIED_CONTAM: Retrovirus-related Pol polyprotein from transposon TNT 1-94 [Sesamum indicum]